MTRSQAFAHYGAKLTNVQWGVCAQAPDGSLVVSLWAHHFGPPHDGVIEVRGRLDRWEGAGNYEFRRALAHALASKQPLSIVIVHTEHVREVEAGADASTLPKDFSVRPDWLGEVVSIEGEEYLIRIHRR